MFECWYLDPEFGISIGHPLILFFWMAWIFASRIALQCHESFDPAHNTKLSHSEFRLIEPLPIFPLFLSITFHPPLRKTKGATTAGGERMGADRGKRPALPSPHALVSLVMLCHFPSPR